MLSRKSLLCILLLLPCLLLFCGCGDNGIVGTWEITECIIDGEALTDLNPCEFHFFEDGTGDKYILDEEQFGFSYSYDGTTCVLYNITYDDGTVDAGTYAEMTVSGKTMTVHATENGQSEVVTLTRKKDN